MRKSVKEEHTFGQKTRPTNFMEFSAYYFIKLNTVLEQYDGIC